MRSPKNRLSKPIGAPSRMRATAPGGARKNLNTRDNLAVRLGISRAYKSLGKTPENHSFASATSS
jgi:hypothetical protein